MMAASLDGRRESRRLLRQLRARLRTRRRPVTLATVLVGQRYDSALYVRLKRRAAADVGIRTRLVRLPDRATESQLLQVIRRLNRDQRIHGILLQLPLPKQFNTNRIVRAIEPTKDVDGFHPENRKILPPPVAAVEHFIHMAKPGARPRVVLLGRRSVFTNRLIDRFSARGWPVTLRSKNWTAETRRADIIISARGRGPRLTASQVGARPIVIDVGIRKVRGRTVGDVAAEVWSKARAVTPVPGGVGPMTIYYVLANTYKLSQRL